MKAREFSRRDRVAATVKRALAAPIADIARQCDAGMVTVTRVDISPDLRRASVYLSLYSGSGDSDKTATLKEFASRASALQAVLGREMRTKRTPVLGFRLDDGIEREDRINRLLKPQSASDQGA